MAQINTIHFHIQTGDLSGAGTDGNVYLGLGGREFNVDTTRDDFERGAARVYILGDGANIRNDAKNDPRNPQLFTERLANFPVYIRFNPRSESDNWQLQRADLRFNDSLHLDWDTVSLVANDPQKGIWMGVRSGLVVHLGNFSHEPTSASRGVVC